MADHEALDALETILEYTDGVDIQPILDSLAENTGDKDLALAAHLCTLDVEHIHGDTYKADGGEYLVLDDSEADDYEDQCLECLLDDGCVEGADSPYFDREKWKDDARTDGRGHIISSYDGNEDEYGDYFIYRVN